MFGAGSGLFKKFLEQDQEPIPQMPMREPAVHMNDKVMQLHMKKKYQTAMLKKMLEDAGYGDLAKMTTISKRDYEE